MKRPVFSIRCLCGEDACSKAANRPRRVLVAVALCAGLVCLVPAALQAGGRSAKGQQAGNRQESPAEEQAASQATAEQKSSHNSGTAGDPYTWKSLFDGKTLGKWKVPNFGGQSEVVVKDGTIVIGMGDPMTGITWSGPVPRDNYELTLEAKRTKGIDFFATTTFPVADSECSFVVGGWGGTVVGLSCVDYYDASDNFTSQFMAFEDNRWYRIRIRVSKARIECWIDEEKMVDIARKGHKFTIRAECDLCRPLGIATWCTEGVVRNIRIRRLTPEEVAEIEKTTEQ